MGSDHRSRFAFIVLLGRPAAQTGARMATKGAAQASNARPIYTYSNLLPDEVIANVQVALQDAGYYFGPATGSLSVETRAALANYQRDQGLIITDAIDQPTIESLGLY